MQIYISCLSFRYAIQILPLSKNKGAHVSAFHTPVPLVHKTWLPPGHLEDTAAIHNHLEKHGHRDTLCHAQASVPQGNGNPADALGLDWSWYFLQLP